MEVPERKPRLRKTAPTIRERVVSSQQPTVESPGKLKKAASRIRKPLNRVRLPQNRFTAKLGRLLRKIVPSYFINSWREVRQVTWPTRRETWRLTGAVFVFAVVFGAVVAAVDKGLSAIFRNFILK